MSRAVILEIEKLHKDDTSERMVKRYLKKYKKLKLGEEIRKHDHFVSKAEERREKKRKSVYRAQKAQEERNLLEENYKGK